jgi:hypothetical protein
MGMSEAFDADGLLAALTEAMKGGEDGIGLSNAELCKKLGKNDRAVLKLLHKVAESGKLGTSKKRIIAIDGSMPWVSTYYIKS